MVYLDEKRNNLFIIIIVIIFVLIMLLILNQILFSNYDNLKIERKNNLRILISNESYKHYNISLYVLDSNRNEIFNKSFFLEPHEIKYFRNITEIDGLYSLSCIIEYKLVLKDEKVIVGTDRGELYAGVGIYIYDTNDVRFTQPKYD